jgi:PAS domain-containing protein
MRSKLADLFNAIAANATTFAQPVLAHLCRMAAIEAENAALPWADAPRLSIAGIWDWDVTNDVNRVDPAGAHFLGIVPSRAGKGLPNSHYLQALHPEDIDTVNRSLGKAIKGGGVWQARYRIIASGQPVWASGKGCCFIDKSNRPERFTGAIMVEDEA